MGALENRIAEHVVQTRFEDLPSEVVERTKEKILDTVGVMAAGSVSPGSGAVAGLLLDLGGRDDSTVLFTGRRLPAPHAAQIHGTWAHADEYCDSDDRQTLKCSATVVPIALALAEMAGASGRDVILAVAVGYDLGCRLGLALTPRPATIGRDEGVFSGAVTGAKLLGLDREGVLDAMGAGYTQLAVAGMSLESPSLTKRLIPGQINRAATWAAMLAARGFTTGRELFEGPKGYFRTFRGTDGSVSELTDELGRRWEVPHCPKPYPSGRFVHPAVDAALSLRARGLALDELVGATVHLSRRASDAIGGRDDAGRATKVAPTGMVDAQTSVPYNVAVALRRGTVTLADFNDEAIRDDNTLRIASMVDEAVDPTLDDTSDMITPVVVELRLRDGTVLSERVDHALGHPLNPCSPEQMEAKFRACLAHARPASPATDADDVIEYLSHLEDADDIGAMMKVMA